MKPLIFIFAFICSTAWSFADGLVVGVSVEKTGKIKEGTYAGRAACRVLVSIENRSSDPIRVSFMFASFYTSFRVAPESEFMIPDWSSMVYKNYPGTRILRKGDIEQFELPIVAANSSAILAGKSFRLGFVLQDERHISEKPFETDSNAAVVWSAMTVVPPDAGAQIDFWGRKRREPNKTTTDNLRGVAPAVSEP